MNDDERRALEELHFDWAVAPDDVWEPSPFHVDQLHDRAARAVLAGLASAQGGSGASPIGLVIEGQRGAGKTHMLGWVREQLAYRDGYFFLVGLYEAGSFWEAVALGMVEGLLRPTGPGAPPQLVQLLTILSHRAGLDDAGRAEVVGTAPLARPTLDALVGGIRRVDRGLGQRASDTLRALALYASDGEPSDIGYDHLLSVGGADDGDRRHWGLRHPPKRARETVRDLSHIMALTGPMVVAVDQIDTLLAASFRRTQDAVSPDDDVALDLLAHDLMNLRQETRRALTLLACLPDTWALIKGRAMATVPQRFREVQLQAIPGVEVGRELIEKRFGARFRRIGFVPPCPTWPVHHRAFAGATDYTPRGLLQRIDRHIEACLADGEVRELTDLDDGVADPLPPPPPVVTPRTALLRLDQRFEELRAAAEVGPALDQDSEDEVVPRLLNAGLRAWIGERGEEGRAAFAVDPPPGRKPSLHARLKRTLDERSEHEAHWSFRAIGTTHGNATLGRLRAARTAAGLRAGASGRALILLRNVGWGAGPKTKAEVTELLDLGMNERPLIEDDLRTFSALEALLAERPDHLQAWLAARRPASGTKLLGDVLGGVADEFTSRGPMTSGNGIGSEGTGSVPEASPAGPTNARPDPGDEAGTLLVGLDSTSGEPIRLGLESLRRHTAIFAGSGSGKTVLIRRLVEGCARQGVSAIVLDPNNDLARLGDAWPSEPDGWLAGDAARAADYLADTEVVVWTPGRQAGNPLAFQPLPDFATVIDDPDEFEAAVDAAVSALAPHAKVDGRTAKAQLGRAVLKEALRYFAEAGSGGLGGFVDVLGSLPVGVSGIKDANRIGRDMAQLLTAARVNNPLFGGAGAAAGPGMLLTPSPGKRARVSVVNLVGLPADEMRQAFVNQLQMALFSWVKAHPAGDRPLGGLFVMDEAQTLAPSGELTPSTRSTLTLASQARKYGLGLVFATQAPKGLHNQIPGNAFTQFFGYLNSPAQIAAANEMARAKGSRVADISRVGTGEFYVSGDGVTFRRAQVPMCLSHHPSSPLTTEDVLERARAGT